MRPDSLKSLIALLSLASLAGPAACAETLGDIDRTQPDRVDKTLLRGQWYYLQTLVEAPYTARFTFVGEQQNDPMDRIVWEIQEGFLYARRAREFVYGERDAVLGAPLAAFAITSHFDVIRQYHDVTGEQTNVIVENSEDRPWYERRYMRVDWSRNLADDFDFFETSMWMQDASVMAISDYQGEEALDDPDRTRVTDGYIDTTQRLFVQPQPLCEDWNDDGVVSSEECDPGCWFDLMADCAGAEVRLRHSFLRVDERDYAARHYDDHDMEKFGYFRSERFDHDRRRGVTEVGRRYWQQRWNIWSGSLTQTPCTEDAQCGAAPGQACDPVRRVCTAPYTAREVRPIVYHLSAGFPAAQRDAAYLLAAEWDRVFQTTVNEVRYAGQREVACLPGPQGGAGAPCCTDADYAAGDARCVPHVFVLRDNSCSFEAVADFARRFPEMAALRDATAGGPPGDLAALLRVCAAFEHSTLDAPDPARRFRWQRPGDLRHSMLHWVDNAGVGGLLGYGPSSADPETGEIVQASAFNYGASVDELAQKATDYVRVVNGDLAEDDVLAGVNVRDYVEARRAAAQAAERRSASPPHERALAAHRAAHADGDGAPRAGRGDRARPGARARTGDPRRPSALSRETLARLRERIAGTALEARLIPDHQRLLAGQDPADLGRPLTAAERRRLSPVDGQARRRAERRKAMVRRAMRRNMYLAEFADASILGYAKTLAGKDEDAIHAAIAERVFASTAEHEVGHTLGLRHNFAGSADPLNFLDGYWALRGAEPEPFTDEIAYTDAQVEGQMALLQYSSIMDYGAGFQSDIQGLGSYDEAAIAYGYGGLVRQFAELPSRIENRIPPGGTIPDVLSDFHYTRYPELFGGSTAALSNRTWSRAGADPRREVPFKFCSDEYAGALWDCDVWDRGADAYEITRYAADSYREYYIFDAYRRQRYGFDPSTYSGHVAERYFLVPMKLFQHWYYYDDGTEDWATDPDLGQPLTLAADEALRLFWDVMTTPDRGALCYDDADGLWYPERFWQACAGTDGASLAVPLGEGKPPDVQFDLAAGYYFYDKVVTPGSWYDKAAAMDAMSAPETVFLGVDGVSSADALVFTFFDGFPELMTRLFGGMMAERPDWYAGRVVERNGVAAFERYDPVLPGGGDATFRAAAPAYPEIDFNLQVWAAWDAMPYFTWGWDQRFNDAVRIYVKGSGEDSTPADPAREATFEDPFSGRIYAALRYDERYVSPGWQMVTDMQALADRIAAEAEPGARAYLESALRFKIDLVDTYRGLYDLYGKST